MNQTITANTIRLGAFLLIVLFGFQSHGEISVFDRDKNRSISPTFCQFDDTKRDHRIFNKALKKAQALKTFVAENSTIHRPIRIVGRQQIMLGTNFKAEGVRVRNLTDPDLLIAGDTRVVVTQENILSDVVLRKSVVEPQRLAREEFILISEGNVNNVIIRIADGDGEACIGIISKKIR